MRRRDFFPALTGGLAASAGLAGTSVRCILITLNGGASQLDTFDPKSDAPVEVRGPFHAIRTSVPGIRISSLFPRLARNAEKFSIIRSVHHDVAPTHEKAWRSLALPGATWAEPTDLQPEPERFLSAYGNSSFSRSCLRARQLVEHGERFVRVRMFGRVDNQPTWDVHGYAPFSDFAAYGDIVGPLFDIGLSALLEDLAARGLYEETIVACLPEFGRSPRINSSGGRDHWTDCYSALIGGGPIKRGEIFGASDATASYPTDSPVTPQEIIATLCHATRTPSPNGLPRLTNLLA